MKQDLIKLKDAVHTMMESVSKKTKVKIDRSMSISEPAINKLAEITKQEGKNIIIINQYQGDINISMWHFSNILTRIDKILTAIDRKDVYISMTGIDKELLKPHAQNLWARNIKLTESVTAYKNLLGELALEQAGGNHRKASLLSGMAKSWFAKLKEDVKKYDVIEYVEDEE
jgi:hypothetical protein